MGRLTFADLYCGCGGASLGLVFAGYSPVCAADIDPVACGVYERNLGLKPVCADLKSTRGDELLSSAGLKAGDVDLVVGCPPCQAFSSLRRTRGADGIGGKSHVLAFADRVKEIRPKAVIFENVPGLIYPGGLEYLKKFVSSMEKLGYSAVWGVLNAEEYGVPQFRRRIFVVCVEGGRKPFLPDKTHAPPAEAGGRLKPWRTVRDAIGDLPPLKPGQAFPGIPNHRARRHSPKVLEMIRRVPKDGGSRKSLPIRYWLRCHLSLAKAGKRGAESVYGRMAWDRPSPTITCRCTTPSSGRFIHPEQDRAITPREAARLQSFPDDFVFPDSFEDAERLVGNAVPPLLMAAVGSALEDFL